MQQTEQQVKVMINNTVSGNCVQFVQNNNHRYSVPVTINSDCYSLPNLIVL